MRFRFFCFSLLPGILLLTAPAAFGQSPTNSNTSPARQTSKPAEQTGRKERVFRVHVDFIPSVAFSPDGKRLASAGNHSVKMTEVETGKELLKLKNSRGMYFFSVAFSPDGKTLVGAQTRFKQQKTRKEGKNTVTTLFYEGEVLVWDARTGEVKARLNDDNNPAWALAFSPDGKWLAVGAGPVADESDKECKKDCIAYGEVMLWDTTTWTLSRRMRGKSAAFRSVAFSPDGKLIAGGSALVDGHRGASVEEESRFEIFLWDSATGDLKQTLPGHTGAISALTFSPDGSLLASAGRDRALKIWDARTFDLKKTASDYLLSVSELESMSETEGRRIGKRGIPPVSWLVGINFSCDGKQLIGGSNDGIIRFYDVESATITSVLKPNGWPVFDTPPSSFDRQEYSLPANPSFDARINPNIPRDVLTDSRYREVIYSPWPHYSGTLHSVAISPDGKTLALGNFDGKVRLMILE